jgi:xeroderma pigmentosum group C-complementing protein
VVYATMPPFLPRKSLRSPSPEDGSTVPIHQAAQNNGKGKGREKSVSASSRKPTLFDDLDAGTAAKRSAERSKALIEKLANEDEADDSSSLSSFSDEEFEDVPGAQTSKINETTDEDEDMEFEDVQTHFAPRPEGPVPSGDLELTLHKDTRISMTNPLGAKKGPSKIERGIRISTHQAHVQMLMFHNAVRNSWLCDSELQQLLLTQLPPSVEKEVERWKRDSGLVKQEDRSPKGRGGGKNKEKGKAAGGRSNKEWGEPSKKVENGQVNMSHGDPILKLLKVLNIFWGQRFRVTAPGLRKLGYKSLERLDEEVKSFNNGGHDLELHGETFATIAEFRKCASSMEGSRDVGAQLYTALLRGLGIEARMVASLQPVGFGWSQNEEATENNPRKLKEKRPLEDDEESSLDEDSDSGEEIPKSTKGESKAAVKLKKVSKSGQPPPRRNPKGTGRQNAPIDLSDSEGVMSEDDESVIDITPAKKPLQPSKPYDKDIHFPHYWTEVLSPVTNTYTAVDPVVLRIIATSEELLGKFETRGSKADKAKQVTAYIIGHSPDGTAKDVTTRYLKRHMWPGRTKGNRLPAEKLPVYNRHGKVKGYEIYDCE